MACQHLEHSIFRRGCHASKAVFSGHAAARPLPSSRHAAAAAGISRQCHCLIAEAAHSTPDNRPSAALAASRLLSDNGCIRTTTALPHGPSLSRKPRKPTQRATQCSAAAQIFTSVQLPPALQLPHARDAAAMLLAAVGAVAWIKLFDFMARHEVLDQKLSRKLVHITAGPLFVLMWPFFSSSPNARFYAAIIPALNSLRLILIGTGVVHSENTVRAVSREGDRLELLRGPLYYVVILVLVTLVYWRESPVGLLVVALMCGGDGIADIIGRRFGKSRLPHNSNKSWAGSIAMLTGGVAMGMAYMTLFATLGFFHFDVARALPAVAGVAAAATVMESLPINQWVDDNLSVPGVAAVMGYYALRGLW